MYKYQVVIEFTSETELAIMEVIDLFNEQWEQTSAVMEGDIIKIKRVEKI